MPGPIKQGEVVGKSAEIIQIILFFIFFIFLLKLQIILTLLLSLFTLCLIEGKSGMKEDSG